MPTTDNVDCDVLILGAGSVGLTLAVAVKHKYPDTMVRVLDRRTTAGNASAASGAMLGLFAELTPYTLRTAAGRAKFELARQANSIWQGWIDDLNSDSHVDERIELRRGTQVILNSRSGRIDDECFQAILVGLREYNEPFVEQDLSAVAGFDVPAYARPLRSLFIPNEGYVDSSVVLRALRRRATQFSIPVDADSLQSIAVNADGTFIVSASQRRIVAARLVVAAGVWTGEIVKLIGDAADRVLPIFAGVGSALQLRSENHGIEHVLRTPNRSFSCGLHTVPRSADSLYIGATNGVAMTPAVMPTVSDLSLLLNCATEQISQKLQTAAVEAINTGNRPVSLDGFPLLGPASLGSLFFATGTYREGFHLAPAISALLADAVCGRDTYNGISVFRPERRPIQIYTRDEAQRVAAKHFIGMAYERGLTVPQVSAWERRLEDMIHHRVEQIYGEMNCDFVIPPDFLWGIDCFNTQADFTALARQCLHTVGS
jgi:glycine oxidase